MSNNNIFNNTTSLQEVLEALQNKAAGGGGIDTSDATAVAADILSGKTAYVDGQKITGTIASVAQATPSITVNASGLITASTTQSSGYITGGTKSTTKQLTTQAAKTITPTKSEQIAIAANVFTTDEVKVAAIPDEYIITNDATAVAEDIMLGETAYIAEGKVTGTFTLQEEIAEQDSLIAQLSSILDEKASGGAPADPVLQDKTVTPTTNTQIVTADNGYDGLDTVTVNAIPSDYVKPIETKAAATYTPGTTNQTISAGTYCSGTQTIKGDANLIPTNIVSGVSIFGVTGSAEAGGGGSSGGTNIETCTVTIKTDDSSSKLGVRIVDGLPVPIYQEESWESLTWEAPCGSIVAVAYPLSDNYICDNATYLGHDDNGIYALKHSMGYLQPVHIFRIDAKAGETAYIQMYEFEPF